MLLVGFVKAPYIEVLGLTGPKPEYSGSFDTCGELMERVANLEKVPAQRVHVIDGK